MSIFGDGVFQYGGQPVGALDILPKKNVLFVCKSTDTYYETFQNRFQHTAYEGNIAGFYATLTTAVAAAQDHDMIQILPGIYDEGAEVVISQKYLWIRGANSSGICWGPCSLKQSAASHHILSIQADGVQISNLGFIQNGAYRSIEIDHTAAVYKTHIHDCHFGGSATATYGVYAGGTYDAVDTVVENCEFLNYATAGVRMNGTRSKTRNCLFMVPASGIGIEYVPGGSDRGYGLIANNYIHGSNSSDTGIKFTGVPDAGASAVMCVNNFVAGCATSITSTTNGEYNALNNYIPANTGAITVVDTDS